MNATFQDINNGNSSEASLSGLQHPSLITSLHHFMAQPWQGTTAYWQDERAVKVDALQDVLPDGILVGPHDGSPFSIES